MIFYQFVDQKYGFDINYQSTSKKNILIFNT